MSGIKFSYFWFMMMLGNTIMAQYSYVPQTIRTPYGNVTTQHAIYTPMHYGNYGQINPKFDFTVVLKSDSVINFRSRVEAEDKKMFVLQKEKKLKRKIFPNDTKEIYGYSSTWGRMKGIPADSCWLFKTYKGAINSYSTLPMKDQNAVIAIQHGDDGEIVALSKKALEAITGTEDEKIVKWLIKNKFGKVIDYYNDQRKVATIVK